MTAPKVTIADFNRFGEQAAKFLAQYPFVTEEIGFGTARMRLPIQEHHLRQGDTVAGPSMMALADYSIYSAIMGRLGPIETAVTSSLNINFLRRPTRADLISEARIVALDDRLAFAEVEVRSDGESAPVAHVTATYAVPRIRDE